MSLRRQMVLLVGLTALAALTIAVGLLQAFLSSRYRDLQAREIDTTLQRTFNQIDEQLRRLGQTTADWGFWDDMQAYAAGQAPEFASDNMQPDTWVNLGVNLVVVTDVRGETIFSTSIDLDQQAETSFPPELLDDLQPGSPLLARVAAEELAAGVLDAGGMPVLVAARPVLGNAAAPPRTGTLIMGQYLGPGQVALLEKLVGASVSIFPASGPTTPEDVRAARLELEAGQAMAVRVVSQAEVAGYRWLRDLYGQPAFVLRVILPRDLYWQGRQTTLYVLTGLSLLSLLLAGMFALLIERQVLRPVSVMAQAVRQVQETQDLSLAAPAAGPKELVELGQDLRAMLAEMARSRALLVGARQELEARVAARTAELQRINAALEAEVAERRRAEAQLAEARDQALEALQFRDQIVANVSHEARTPLTVIMLRGELLGSERYGPLNARQRQAMDAILLNTRQLLGFMENLLTESQASTGRLKLEPERLAPRELLARCLADLEPQARTKGLDLRLEVAPDLPAEVQADPARLRQVIDNLLGNAVQFTAQGWVRLRAGLDGPDHWSLSVADTGPGIAHEHSQDIFEPFWQVDGSATREAGRGVGLGLSIVKQLVDRMGGSLTVGPNPEAASGSVFSVQLPLRLEAGGS